MPSKKSVVVLLGALLIVGSSTVLYFDDRAYQHEVDALDSPPETGDVYNYLDLSENAQTAFVHAYQSSDGPYTVYDEAKKPAEFMYIDDGRPSYTIRYQGNYYKLVTYQAGGHGMGFERVIYGLLGLVIGVGLLVGGWWINADRQFNYSVLGGVIIGSSLSFIGSLWPSQTPLQTALVGGWVVCLLTTLGIYTLLILLGETRVLRTG